MSCRSLAPCGANFPEPGLRARERSGGCSLSRIPSPHRRDHLRAWPLRPSRASDELPPLTLPVTPARSFDLAGAEDLEPRVTSMTLGRRARSAFRLTSASFVTGRLRGPCARSPATSARLCRRTSASIARFRSRSRSFERASKRRLPRRPKGASSAAAPAFAVVVKEWSALVDVCRPSDPRARSVGLIHPAAMRPRGRSPDAGRRSAQ